MAAIGWVKRPSPGWAARRRVRRERSFPGHSRSTEFDTDAVFITSAGQVGKQSLCHLCRELFEQPARLREVPISEMYERQIEWREPPVGHHLDETTRAQEFRLDHRRQFTDPAARKQCGSETGEIIHGEVRAKGNRFLSLLVLVHEAPTCLWLTAPKRDQRMIEQVPGRFRRPAD